ncbi:LOW QUALITY PROTEIN: zinc finger CCCH domain-containing protein 15 homolog [Drosophila nasuta]|uniref:Zinc finger CCCH domain-containing protein 15 homolog n=1 Tax=Drosophila albomicans TaxID=7291 RepID=A0A6P8XG55_DROAB|nr:zinc finger CCCH domain-containing protein 15 homolog [Drosophila albomicans]XP_060653463.1 LOW QUALITY PROTEIN: zinc finger CCCH domain-containing protein 15 homolog [Drosophila nasuta]
MPPKKAPAPSKKTEQKKKEKVIEDKTFGLKNKKGNKQQKFIQQVQKQVQAGGHHPRADGDKRKEEKEKKLADQRELAMIFKPVQGQKVEKGTDPKSVVCAFFKQGTCTKGDKCKFSHDLSLENKVEKRSMYVDMRDSEDDPMTNWDDAKLKEVVDKKHSAEKRRPTTEIICKYFLEAVEKSKYGWFWECPNGEKCIYRHALPPGYVLKRDKKKEDKPTEISLVDLIEKERAALGPNQTRVTLESFLAWKKRKLQEKKAKLAAEEERKKSDFSKGKQFGISGREMFSFNPDLVDDGPMEEGDAAFDIYNREDDDDENVVEFKELDLAALSLAAQEVDGSGTVASSTRLLDQAEEAAKTAAAEDAAAAATSSVDSAPAINKDLFTDLDLAGELDDLDLDDDDDDDE